MDGHTNTQICKDLNAILPEPKTKEENTFLSHLSNNTEIAFMLGTQRDGHVRRWNSDNTKVTLFNWKSGEPNDEDCVIFWIKHHPQAWLDLTCKEQWKWSPQVQSVVCQRSRYICPYWLGLDRKVRIILSL